MTTKQRFWIALGVSFILAFCDYFMNNCRFPLLDNVDSLSRLEYFIRSTDDADKDSVLYLNVAFDKQLVDIKDDFGDTIGKSVITDRETLVKILNIAEKAQYKFLVMDVRFDKGMNTASDSALWAVMRRLPRFAYSAHEEEENGADPSTWNKSGFSDYGATLTTGFTRWQYVQNKGKSIPLMIYNSLDDKNIDKLGPLYFDGKRLCYNTVFIPLSLGMLTTEKKNGEIRFPLLGGQVLKYSNDSEIQRSMKDKVVIIGDFDNDMHDTYIGSVPGPVLIYRAYVELHNEKHIVKFGFFVFLILLFFTIAYTVMSSKPLISYIPFIANKPFVKNILAFIGWEVVLSTVSMVLYLTMSISFNTLIPAIVFTVMGWWINSRYNNSAKQIKNIKQ